MTSRTYWLRAAPAAIAIASTLALFVPTPANAAKAVVGTLTCKGEGSVGMILGSKESLNCTYKPAGGGQTDHYRATITKIGLDIGVKGPSTLIWSVLGSSDLEHEALLGTYAGISAEAAIAIGGGANVLVGGSNQSVVLQPLSLEGQTGVNLAVGVSEMTLR